MMILTDNKIINMDNIICLYIDRDGRTLKVSYNNGNSCRFALYDNDEECIAALEFLYEKLKNGAVAVKMPDAMEIKSMMRASLSSTRYERSRPTGGVKPRGHGGS